MQTIKAKLIFKKTNPASVRLHFIIGMALIKVHHHSFSSAHLHTHHRSPDVCNTANQSDATDQNRFKYRPVQRASFRWDCMQILLFSESLSKINCATLWVDKTKR